MPDVIIVGGGIGGLVAALALIDIGCQVTVYEQAEEIKEIGAGLQIAANGFKVFRALGVEDKMMAVAAEASAKVIRMWNTGQTWPLFDLATQSVARYDAPYAMFHRSDLHRVLIDAIEERQPDTLRVKSRLVEIVQNDQLVSIKLEDGRQVEGDILIGADGVHSTVRRLLFAENRPAFTGMLAWRGLIPAKELPPHLAEPVGTNWIGPGRHVIHYPVRRGELINFVGIVEREDWQIESWTTRGTIDECAKDFVGWHEDVQCLISHIETPFKWALMGRDPMDSWISGRTALLGDACHPTLPFLAQGAGMAIEDGLVLARAVAALSNQPAEALRLFEATRIERTSKIVSGSAENGRRFHNPALADREGAEAYVNREFEPELVQRRFDWIFKYDAATVPLGHTEQASKRLEAI
jgi:salicylate hydroxylase